jgi:multiple sugar transport system permease protein
MVTSIASISIVLGYLFHKELGVINYYLGRVGVAEVPWLTSSGWALWTIVIATVWKSFGFDLILFIAGIQNIPRHLYEAASIDGASGWQQFWRITIPLLSPTMFFAVVVGLISSFQVFDQAFIMTRGGPGDATRTLVMVIFEDAFGTLRMGYGSAIAMVLFVVILGLTILQFRLSQRWVHYG